MTKTTHIARQERSEASKEQIYDFGNSPVLLTHPAINAGETVEGVFTGNWGTALSGRSSFAITSVQAQLVLPAIDLQLPGKSKTIRTRPGSIYLSKNPFEVPAHLVDFYPEPNSGTFGGKRFYQAVFAMHAAFPYAQGDGDPLNLEPASVLLRTVGFVQRDGSLIASGIGTIVTGLLGGLMFCCSHSSGKPVAPAKCGAKKPNTTWLCTRNLPHPPPHTNAGSGLSWE